MAEFLPVKDQLHATVSVIYAKGGNSFILVSSFYTKLGNGQHYEKKDNYLWHANRIYSLILTKGITEYFDFNTIGMRRLYGMYTQ